MNDSFRNFLSALTLRRQVLILIVIGLIILSILFSRGGEEAFNNKMNNVKIDRTPNMEACESYSLKDKTQAVPATAKLKDTSYYIWGGTMVKSREDGKYHLFFSRWPHNKGFASWVSHSEIAHAVADSPHGPFVFQDIALSPRNGNYWDGQVTHNPTIQYFNGKYYLYYMGNMGDSVVTQDELNWVHRNNQRIGVAVSDSVDGPWARFDNPLIDVSNDNNAHDALMVSNPSVTQMADGRYLMVYKAVAKNGEMPFGGPVVHLTAIAEEPTGPFIKQMKPIFTIQETDFPAEDPYVWYDKQKSCYFAIVKDMKGAFTEAGRSLVLFTSEDGLDWKLTNNPLVSRLNLLWKNGDKQELEALERPQLFFEDGVPVVLLSAATQSYDDTFNVQIPLK